jgi:4-hydroxymandelate oxidase
LCLRVVPAGAVAREGACAKNTMQPINIQDYEELAQQRLPQTAWQYYSGGAHDGLTLRDNRAAWQRLRLVYRVLVDVARRELSTTVLGQPAAMPLLIAPTAFQCMAHPDGELATVRAAGTAGTPMILSSLANTAVEEVLAAARAPVWFQLYVYRDRQVTIDLVRRVEAAGCSALVVTVDAPLWGRREADVRNRFQLPSGLSVKNLLPAGLESFPNCDADSGLAAYIAQVLDPSLTWRDIEWLRSVTRLPVLIKGLVRADDAARAVEHGVSGLIVSNHGGRQLDGSIATADALPRVVEAAAGRVEVLVDGGIRRGTDVVKALALGARGVLIGRPVLWGLAAAGESGVADVLNILRTEIDLAMGLCGCPTVSAITRDLLA